MRRMLVAVIVVWLVMATGTTASGPAGGDPRTADEPGSLPTTSSIIAGSARFVPVEPCRLVDTRLAGGALAPGEERDLDVTGRRSSPLDQGGTPGCGAPIGAVAVEASITAIGPDHSGYARAWPTDQAPPTATILNLTRGRSTTNTAIVPVATSGDTQLRLRNAAGNTHYVIDLYGYYATTDGLRSVPVAPCRVFDSRRSEAGPLDYGGRRLVRITGTGPQFASQGGNPAGCGVPPGALAAQLSITAIDPGSDGFTRVGPDQYFGQPRATLLNFTARTSVTNAATIPLGPDDASQLRLVHAGRTTHYVIDVLGYLVPDRGAVYLPVAPCRVADTRQAGGPLAYGEERSLAVTGSGPAFVAQGGHDGGCAIPAGADAVEASITAVGAGSDGYARAWPADQPQPTATILNVARGRSITNAVSLPLAPDGDAQLRLLSAAADTDYVVDVLGYAVIPEPATMPVTQVTASYRFTCAAIADGTARCWGANERGQLGDGTTTTKHAPVTVAGLGDVAEVTAGSLHSCARQTGGTVWCWGANGGRLGDGTLDDSPTPVAVTGIDDAVELRSGANHTCARLATGAVRCWGANEKGELGDGTTTDSATPVAVTGIDDAVDISLGGGHSCAVLAGGTVRCWGANYAGQLGDGTTTASATPVTVADLTDVVSVGAGGAHTCAVTGSGSVRCWGRNAHGQLGDGTLDDATRPTRAVTGEATQVAGGDDHTCAVVRGGRVQCWGAGTTGQVGDGDARDRTRPVFLDGLVTATQVDGGFSHTCAAFADGTARCWGDNYWGEVGRLPPPYRQHTPLVVPGTA